MFTHLQRRGIPVSTRDERHGPTLLPLGLRLDFEQRSRVRLRFQADGCDRYHD